MTIETKEAELETGKGEAETEAEESTETETTAEDTSEKEEKPQESLEARKSRLERQLNQVNKKLGVDSQEKPKSKSKTKSDDIDYAQEAYLTAKGISEADEIELVKERMVETGKSLKEVVENKYLQQDLKELREAKSTKLAMPTSSKRSSTSARDTVEYWNSKIASGNATLLDIPDVKLRRQVVNSKLASSKSGNHFTNNPFGTMDIK